MLTASRFFFLKHHTQTNDKYFAGKNKVRPYNYKRKNGRISIRPYKIGFKILNTYNISPLRI